MSTWRSEDVPHFGRNTFASIREHYVQNKNWTEPVFSPNSLAVGFYLRKNRLDTLAGALGLVGRGFGATGGAGLGVVLGVLGTLGGLGVAPGALAGLCVLGVRAWAWCCAWGLAVLGALGWVGRGVWPCWARWLGWVWCSK